MQYTTLENLKSYIGIETTDQDALLTATIKRVTQQFDKYLGRNLENKLYTEYIVADDDDMIIVDKGPIVSITSIKYQDDTGDDVEYTRFDENLIFLTYSENDTLYIQYNAGYSSLDDIQDVEQACLEVCKDLWDNTPSSGNEANIKSKKIETLSKTYFSKDEMAGGISVNFRETLDNYKNLNPLII